MAYTAKASSLCLLTSILSLSKLAAGPINSPLLGEKPRLWETSLQMGYLHQLDSDLDNGGSVSVDRTNISAGLTRVFDRYRTIGLSFGYGYDGYDFEGAAANPWSDIHTLSLALPIRWSLSDSWNLLAIPTIRSTGESGANFTDSLNGGFIGGVSYRFGDHLSIGPGFGVLTQIEDETRVFPILIVQWKIMENLQLETGRGFGASQGPGLNLNWQANNKWSLSLGGRFERLRFRLDDQGAAANQIGEDQGLPVYLGATYSISKFSELSFYAGARFGGNITVDNSSGNQITSDDYDVAPFVGMTWKTRF